MNQHTQPGPLRPFHSLPVGSPFRFPICLGQLLLHRGIYYKSAPGWYGRRQGERVFPWLDETPYVETLSAD